ncbi:MAG: hypothetical protein PHV55_07440 [Candidatus Omnitrophica bacterium]|nr:hypothetical protein [Candidatus Omnitrophota bacterium]
MVIFIFLGIISSIFQLSTLREFTFCVAKNEIAFIVACGAWLAACSLGSLFARTRKNEQPYLAFLISLIYSLAISILHMAKYLAGLKYYETAGFGFIAMVGLVTVVPTAFILGYSFSYFVRQNGPGAFEGEKIYAKFFAFEALGFLFGGAAFTFFLSGYSNPFIFSVIPLLLVVALKKQLQKICFGLAIIILSTAFLLGFNFILEKEFSGSKILQNSGSPYGPLIVTDKNKVISLFSSGSLLASSEDKATNEEFIHMALSALEPESKTDILFIGACFENQLQEIAKHGPGSLECLQINPLITGMVQKGLPRSLTGKTEFITDDPRLYVKKKNKQYDIILMDMPPPSTLAFNRYYTEEFFAQLASRLKPYGVFTFHIPGKREILGPQMARFDASIINGLRKAFKNIFIIPGDSMLIMAADKREITERRLLENFRKARIDADFFTIYHFQDYLDPHIRRYIETQIAAETQINSDRNPSGFLNYLLLEQTKLFPRRMLDTEKTKRIIIMAVIIAGIFIILVSLVSKRSSCFLNTWAAGFNSISATAIVFILFQLYSGALFWKLGFLLAFFMAGVSLGTWSLNLLLSKMHFRKVFISLVFLFWMASYLLLLTHLNALGSILYPEPVFYLFSFICGLITGAGYPLFTRDLLRTGFLKENVTAFIYAADLNGAFFGTIISSLAFLPFLGITQCLMILLAFNVVFIVRNLWD